MPEDFAQVRFNAGPGVRRLTELSGQLATHVDTALKEAHEQMASSVQLNAYLNLKQALNPKRAGGRYNDNRGLRKALQDPQLHRANVNGWVLGDPRTLSRYTRHRRYGEIETTDSNPLQYWRFIERGGQPHGSVGFLITILGERTLGPKQTITKLLPKHLRSVNEDFAGAARETTHEVREPRGRARTQRLYNLSQPSTPSSSKQFVREGRPWPGWNGRAESAAAGFVASKSQTGLRFQFRPKAYGGAHFLAKAMRQFKFGAGGPDHFYRQAFSRTGLRLPLEFKGRGGTYG